MTLELVIDIDGIITNEVVGHNYNLRTVNEKAVEQIRKAHARGHLIILYTSRQTVDWLCTSEWLKEHDVPYHHLVMGKPCGALYVDDRAVPDTNLLQYLDCVPPCWNENHRTCCPAFNFLPTLTTKPRLSLITLIRLRDRYCSLANEDIPDLTSEINLNGFVDNDIITMYREAFKKCNKIKG